VALDAVALDAVALDAVALDLPAVFAYSCVPFGQRKFNDGR
jgi:hypothetical protein